MGGEAVRDPLGAAGCRSAPPPVRAGASAAASAGPRWPLAEGKPPPTAPPGAGGRSLAPRR